MRSDFKVFSVTLTKALAHSFVFTIAQSKITNNLVLYNLLVTPHTSSVILSLNKRWRFSKNLNHFFSFDCFVEMWAWQKSHLIKKHRKCGLLGLIWKSGAHECLCLIGIHAKVDGMYTMHIYIQQNTGFWQF